MLSQNANVSDIDPHWPSYGLVAAINTYAKNIKVNFRTTLVNVHHLATPRIHINVAKSTYFCRWLVIMKNADLGNTPNISICVRQIALYRLETKHPIRAHHISTTEGTPFLDTQRFFTASSWVSVRLPNWRYRIRIPAGVNETWHSTDWLTHFSL